MKSLAKLTLLPVLFLAACASTSTLEKSDMSESTSHIVDAPKLQAVQATEKAITNLGFKLTNTKNAEPTSEIYFSKPMSAFSWGEVGRVDVRTISEKASQLSVGSEKRYQLQLTGTGQNEFAKKIFTEVDKIIAQ